jgi:hypothetical protein
MGAVDVNLSCLLSIALCIADVQRDGAGSKSKSKQTPNSEPDSGPETGRGSAQDDHSDPAAKLRHPGACSKQPCFREHPKTRQSGAGEYGAKAEPVGATGHLDPRQSRLQAAATIAAYQPGSATIDDRALDDHDDIADGKSIDDHGNRAPQETLSELRLGESARAHWMTTIRIARALLALREGEGVRHYEPQRNFR